LATHDTAPVTPGVDVERSIIAQSDDFSHENIMKVSKMTKFRLLI